MSKLHEDLKALILERVPEAEFMDNGAVLLMIVPDDVPAWKMADFQKWHKELIENMKWRVPLVAIQRCFCEMIAKKFSSESVENVHVVYNRERGHLLGAYTSEDKALVAAAWYSGLTGGVNYLSETLQVDQEIPPEELWPEVKQQFEEETAKAR